MNQRAGMETRLLTESDLAEAMRLKELVRWNQTESDWRRLLRLEPRGCFAVDLDNRPVATTTTTTYGTDLAWVGMVLVDPEYRRRGIATRLLRAALDYLNAQGIAAVKLDATPAGQPVYEALGFVREGLIERWEAVAQAVSIQDQVQSGSIDLPQMSGLDREAFGADRARLLELLLADSCVKPLAVYAPDSQLRGYALARRGAVATYLGPIVAADEPTAVALLDGMLNQLAGRKVYLDFHTGCPLTAVGLSARGFTRQRDLIRMRRGGERAAGTSPLVCAIAGPEIG